MPASFRAQGLGTHAVGARGVAVGAALALLPLLVVVPDALSADPGEAASYLLRPRVGELLTNTGMLFAVTVPATVVVGVVAAWLVERTPPPPGGGGRPRPPA